MYAPNSFGAKSAKRISPIHYLHFMLKTLTITLLCLILLLQPVNNLLIVFSYVVNKEFIATVLCIDRDVPESDCEGSCQVTEQFKEQEKKETGREGTLSNKSDISLYLPSAIENPYPPTEKFKFQFTLTMYIPEPPPYSIFHPPKNVTRLAESRHLV